MSELRRAWRDLGKAGFLSPSVLVAFVIWTTLTASYYEVATGDAPLLLWLVVTFASSAVVAGLLIVVRRLSRNRWPEGPRPQWAVALYLISGALRGVLLWALVDGLDLETSIGLTTRIAQSALWALASMGATGIVVARVSAHRALMSQLAQRQHELLNLQTSLTERIAQTRRDLITQVRETLEPTLTQLREQLDMLSRSGDAEVGAAIAGFRTAVADVVRPLSRALAEPPDPTAHAESPGGVPRSWFATERIPVSLAIQPGTSAGLLLATMAFLSAAPTPDAYRSTAAPVRLVVLVTLVWLALGALRWAARRLAWQSTVVVMLAPLAALFTVTGVFVGLLTRFITANLAEAATTVPALAAALSVLIPLTVAAATLVQELARRTEADRAATVAELEVLTSVLRRELWREHRRLALTVHGPIQSALVAAAITMSRDDFSIEEVPRLAAALDQAMAHIDRASGPQPPVAAAASDLAALWADSASVRFTGNSEALDVINHDDALRTVVVEILREGVSNAIRHGAADNIDVAIECTTSDTIAVLIDDDGDGPPIAQVPGLGSAMLDEIALDWGLERTPSRTRLRVELALTAERG